MSRTISAVVLASLLEACSSGGGLTPSGSPAIPQSMAHVVPSTSANCTSTPIKGLQVSATTLRTSVGATTSFKACTQHFSNYTLSVSPSGIVTVPSSVTPTQPTGDGWFASISVKAVAAGSATISVSDKKGDRASVAVTVTVAKRLFVTNASSNTITEYVSPYTGSPIATISNSVSEPIGLAFGRSGDLFVANADHSTVTEYAPPYTGAPIATISNSVSEPTGLAFGASGTLFVANFRTNTVTEYAPPYTGAPTATTSRSLSGPEDLAFDSSGDLFVANEVNDTVTEYASPYTGSPIATILNGASVPFGLAFDANGNLFVANGGNNTVTEYVSPYTGAPTTTISSGLSEPAGVAFGP